MSSALSGTLLHPPTLTVSKQQEDDLIAEDVLDLSTLLPSVSGLDLGSLGQFSSLVVRGQSAQATEWLMDDYALREPIMGFVNPGYARINLIDEMKFHGIGGLGPFGLQGHAGLVQTTSFSFHGTQPYSKVLFRAGDWGYSDIGLIVGLPVSSRVDFLLAASRQEYNGFQANRGHEGGKFFSRISYSRSRNFNLEATSMLNKNDVQIPAPLLPDFGSVSAGDERKETRFDQIVSAKLGNVAEGEQLSAQIAFSRIRQESISDSVLFDNKDLTFTSSLQYKLKTGRHWWTVGGAFQYDRLKNDLLPIHSDLLNRVFVGGELALGANLVLVLQSKFEKKKGFPAVVDPSGAATWAPSQQVSFWLGGQRTTRYPSFAERFWPTNVFSGNPGLAAERGTSGELGASLKPETSLEVRSSLFASAVSDWIGTVALGDTLVFGAVNLGTRTLRGADFQFLWNPSASWSFGVIGSYLDVKEPEAEKQLQVPEYSVYGFLQAGRPFFDNYVFIKLRVAGRFLGSRFGRIVAGNQIIATVAESGTDGLLGGRLILQFSDAMLALSMENILDRRYQLVPGFFMPPRTFRFTITWEFRD